MTRDEVLALKPGRESDALIAEKVMGWKIRREIVLTYGSNPLATFRTLYTVTDGRGIDWSPTYDLDGVDLPRYSTDIGAAWEVVEKVDIVEISKSYRAGGEWYWSVFVNGNCTYAKSVPEAICKAALLAVMDG